MKCCGQVEGYEDEEIKIGFECMEVAVDIEQFNSGIWRPSLICGFKRQ